MTGKRGRVRVRVRVSDVSRLQSLGVFYISRTIFHGTQFDAYGTRERRGPCYFKPFSICDGKDMDTGGQKPSSLGPFYGGTFSPHPNITCTAAHAGDSLASTKQVLVIVAYYITRRVTEPNPVHPTCPFLQPCHVVVSIPNVRGSLDRMCTGMIQVFK